MLIFMLRDLAQENQMLIHVAILQSVCVFIFCLFECLKYLVCSKRKPGLSVWNRYRVFVSVVVSGKTTRSLV